MTRAERTEAEFAVGPENDRPVLPKRRRVREDHLRLETSTVQNLGLDASERSAS